jgi:hypothetical protein
MVFHAEELKALLRRAAEALDEEEYSSYDPDAGACCTDCGVAFGKPHKPGCERRKLLDDLAPYYKGELTLSEQAARALHEEPQGEVRPSMRVYGVPRGGQVMPKFKIGQRVRITGGYERGMALTITHIGLWPNDTTHTYTGHFDNGAPCKLHYVESSLSCKVVVF